MRAYGLQAAEVQVANEGDGSNRERAALSGRARATGDDRPAGHDRLIHAALRDSILDLSTWSALGKLTLVVAPLYLLDRVLAVTRWNTEESLKLVEAIDFTKALQVVIGSAVSLHPWTELLIGSVVALFGTYAWYTYGRAVRAVERNEKEEVQIATVRGYETFLVSFGFVVAAPLAVWGLAGFWYGLLMSLISASLYALHAEADPEPEETNWATRPINNLGEQTRAAFASPRGRKWRAHLAAGGTLFALVFPWAFVAVALFSSAPWMPLGCVDVKELDGTSVRSQVYVVTHDSDVWTILHPNSRLVDRVPGDEISFSSGDCSN